MKKTRSTGAAATRERILDAAIRVVEKDGVGAATTKRIAAEAKVAEGSLYNHFADKPELLISLVLERMPDIKDIFAKLFRPGETSTAERLCRAIPAMIDFYTHAQLVGAGVSADPELLRLCRRRFAEAGLGPHLAHLKLAEFLREEQNAGRIKPGAKPDIIAALLIGACTEYAGLSQMTGKTPGGLKKPDYAKAVVATLSPLLFP